MAIFQNGLQFDNSGNLVTNVSGVSGSQTPTPATITLATTEDNLPISAGVTRLIMTPASGGSTVNGIALSGVSDGYALEIINDGDDSIMFPDEALTSTDIYRISTTVLGVQVGPGQNAIARYVVNRWRFFS